MRKSSIDDCIRILNHFGVDPSRGEAIDVGGTETVYLDTTCAPNPLFALSPNLTLLDKGSGIEAYGTKADEVVDFLDLSAILHLQGRFDLVYCFDTLEHVPNPFLFCEHLIHITKPGGYIYAATVFEWPYHPAPGDYFRFSPTGLLELFQSPLNRLVEEFAVLWCGWGSDGKGVALLGQRCAFGSSGNIRHDPASCTPIAELLAVGKAITYRKETWREKMRRFLRKPWREKLRSLHHKLEVIARLPSRPRLRRPR